MTKKDSPSSNPLKYLGKDTEDSTKNAPSMEEIRKLALHSNLRPNPFWQRFDLIPPANDPRTALIDRALVLQGLLTEKQLKEIHEVGDLWLRYQKGKHIAEVLAHQSAKEALDALRQRRRKHKQEKQRIAQKKREAYKQKILKRKQEEILYLGPGVSQKLFYGDSQEDMLTQKGLPILHNVIDVADVLSIPIPKLRWLCFHNPVAQQTHYTYFTIPKRTGGTRKLSSPKPLLARTQTWILHNILEKLSIEPCAHGFIKKRSTLTNAIPHLDHDLLIKLDLVDFFPSITFPRVRGLFESIGYSPSVATVLALLCTEAPRCELEYKEKRYMVATGNRSLPQGACTSPTLSNQIAKKLDRRLMGMCKKQSVSYTRYADDLSFSGRESFDQSIGHFLSKVSHIVTEEGFCLHPKKKYIRRSSQRQSVTGIVVNKTPSLPREETRKIRAILHNAKQTGLSAQNRQNIPNFTAWLSGKIAYLSMVKPKQGKVFREALDLLLASTKKSSK